MVLSLLPPPRLIVDYCDCGLAKWWGQQEFAIPQNVLEIVYGQTICWIGTFYCPLLPAICTIKYFIIFYIKKVAYHRNTRPYQCTVIDGPVDIIVVLCNTVQ